MPDTPHDTEFTLPALDDPASTETGVILMGLDVERLLAGLGLATLADDPAVVALVVDRVRHGALRHLTPEGLVEAGARRWRSLRPAVAEAALDPVASGSLRRSWERATRVLAASLDGTGPASLAYVTACWFRREDVDEYTGATGSDGELYRVSRG
ncbi:DUF6187 family protein [Amycolatopsis sp.]|uniref:DUF6187 family protein n=1 Tax=Amycolatopsis sp. TaxID=37632 RepID=UPI002E0ADF4D|nr:DUF6187 family protein [Amycolatopsis sp.]